LRFLRGSSCQVPAPQALARTPRDAGALWSGTRPSLGGRHAGRGWEGARGGRPLSPGTLASTGGRSAPPAPDVPPQLQNPSPSSSPQTVLPLGVPASRKIFWRIAGKLTLLLSALKESLYCRVHARTRSVAVGAAAYAPLTFDSDHDQQSVCPPPPAASSILPTAAPSRARPSAARSRRSRAYHGAEDWLCVSVDVVRGPECRKPRAAPR
jgi:hypothetical protein